MVKFSSEAGHPWAVLGVYGPVEPADRAGFYFFYFFLELTRPKGT